MIAASPDIEPAMTKVSPRQHRRKPAEWKCELGTGSWKQWEPAAIFQLISVQIENGVDFGNTGNPGRQAGVEMTSEPLISLPGNFVDEFRLMGLAKTDSSSTRNTRDTPLAFVAKI